MFIMIVITLFHVHLAINPMVNFVTVILKGCVLALLRVTSHKPSSMLVSEQLDASVSFILIPA